MPVRVGQFDTSIELSNQDSAMQPLNIVYALCEPITGEVRYVGKSCSGLTRPNQHLYRSVQTKTHLYNWIRAVQARGEQPVIKVLADVEDRTSLGDEEQFFISYLRSLGANLTNLTAGGDGAPGRKVSKATRKRLAAANKVWQTPEKCQQIADRLSERCKDPTVLDGYRERANKQYSTEEGRKSTSDGQRKRYEDPNERLKSSASQKLRFSDPEELRKHSEARKGKPNPKKCKALIDQNGAVYLSIKDAAASVGVCPASIHKVLNGKATAVRGYTFTYLTKDT